MKTVDTAGGQNLSAKKSSNAPMIVAFSLAGIACICLAASIVGLLLGEYRTASVMAFIMALCSVGIASIGVYYGWRGIKGWQEIKRDH